MALLFRLLSRLPLPVLHNLGALLGWLSWLFSPPYRRHLRENIRQAGDWAESARIAAIAEAGKGIAELPRIWLRPQEEVAADVVRVSGWELVEEVWRSKVAGQGIILITPHLGCFEIVGQYYASRLPITALYREPRQAWLRALVERGRGGASLKLAKADLGGVRTLMKALKRGETIGVLPDQVPGNGEGIWAPFFGRPAYTMTLAARLAEGGATVLLTYAERLVYGAGYHLHFRTLSAPLCGTLPERTAQLNHELEALIRECPSQYLWGYNRYKVPAGVALPLQGDGAP